MRTEARDIEFIPVTAEHYELLRIWLNAPHMREWWGEPEVELGYIRDMVEGRDTTRPFLFAVDGEPAGYIQYWFIGDHQNDAWTRENPWLLELPSDTVGVDLSIGDETSLSRGIGSAALSAFVRRLVGEGHRNITIDPHIDNARAIRAYEKAGFRTVVELLGRTGDTLILRYETAVV